MILLRLKITNSVLTLLAILVFSSVISSGAEGVRSLKLHAKNLYYGIGVQQNYTKALSIYMQAARLGDSDAKYIAGAMYFKGLGTDKDFTRAFQLLHQAASEGKSTPESQKVLAQGFLIGQGTHKHYKKALEWYTLAAENGNSEAQNELGFIYFTGNGVEQDMEKGGELFSLAARNGMAIAQYNMGIIYYTGNGVEQSDLLKSYAWMNIAATGGHGPARAARNYLETILSRAELVEAHSLTDSLLSEIQ